MAASLAMQRHKSYRSAMRWFTQRDRNAIGIDDDGRYPLEIIDNGAASQAECRGSGPAARSSRGSEIARGGMMAATPRRLADHRRFGPSIMKRWGTAAPACCLMANPPFDVVDLPLRRPEPRPQGPGERASASAWAGGGGRRSRTGRAKPAM